ncbi:T9SS type B sorting domain-containing protein [Tamlana sp. s12]|uniref:T9SS type B sorting domain-containing protein n=1 Tax=Tamlana sp. s12 TaxID=1630406 RepID=UPI000801ED2D|nr:T9SS type B sorting domain-containing protein [Tamlana sp. s12]OBQ56489.1 hypothetical protein VQ01_03805 [Tamlana sp. s12]QQY81886.1 T9SS type B sorting domain-containing protein [Tamlana sp. s12]
MLRNFIALFCIISIHTFAQNQAANWYFGKNSGIHFDSSTNTVTPVFNGKINTLEGCTSISDNSGHLLFYTDGITVWNKNHEIMVNGFWLYGNPSSSQSAIIVPKPNHPNIYYIFTVDHYGGPSEPSKGLNYSEVDLSLDGGLGAVTSKNINLLSNSTEKVTAVLKDCRDKSIWVLSYASKDGTSDVFDTFHAFEITDAGVNTNSVKSTLSKQVLDRRGYLKLSPDGLKLACANSYDGLDLYDFDISTGLISNHTPLILPGIRSAYGVEFSPNSELLYTQTSNILPDFADINDPNIHNSQLVQFDIYAANVAGSVTIIDNRKLYRGALQMGPNGKIYRALSASYNTGLPYLGVINEPNKRGLACDYVHDAIDLSPSFSTQGLPPFISSFFNKQIDIIKNGKQNTSLSLCEGETYTLQADPISGATYSWFKNNTPLPETGHKLPVYDSGYYEVIVSPNNGECDIEGAASVIFNPNPTALDMTLLQCEDDLVFDGKSIFNLNEAINDLTGNATDVSVKFYLDAARTNQILDQDKFVNTSNPQTIYTSVVNDNTTCISFSELTLEVSNTNIKSGQLFSCDDDGIEDGYYIFNLKDADAFILDGSSIGLDITYYETYEDALLEQNPLTDQYQNLTPYSQIIFARAENANNCYGINEIELKVQEPFTFLDDSTTYYCLNRYPEKIAIDAGLTSNNSSDYSYLWSTGESTYSIDINAAGIYSVTLTNLLGCERTRSITVEASNIATINHVEVKDARENNVVSIMVTGESTYQYQLTNTNNNFSTDYQDSNVFENVHPGLYTVSVKDVKNDCGTTNELISVIGFPKFFTPNNDGINDTWQVYGVSEAFQANTKILIFNRYGKLLKELHPLGEGWNGTFKGEKLPHDDYWFSVKLADGRLFKNHFTLKP